MNSQGGQALIEALFAATLLIGFVIFCATTLTRSSQLWLQDELRFEAELCKLKKPIDGC